MKLKGVNKDEFTTLIQLCQGRVCLVTSDGDQLVVNSPLSDRIGLQTILQVARHRDITITCDNQSDQKRIEAYLAART